VDALERHGRPRPAPGRHRRTERCRRHRTRRLSSALTALGNTHRDDTADTDLDRADTVVDDVALALHNRRERGSPWAAGGIVTDACKLVWRAARRPFLLVGAITVLSAAATVGQVLVGAWLLAALLSTGGWSVEALLPPLLVLTALAVGSLALGAATTQVQRLLGVLAVRDVERRIIDVTTSVSLDAYESPGFVTTLTRVELNGMTKPPEVVAALVSLVGGLTATVGLAIVLVRIEPLLLPLVALATVPLQFVNRSAAHREFAAAVEQAAGLRERHYLGDVLRQRETAKEVRAFDLADIVRGRWEARYGSFVAALRVLVKARIGLAVLGALGAGAMLLATLLLLVWQVRDGAVPLADAGAALIALRMMASRVQALGGGASRLFESRLFLKDLAAFLALVPRSTPAPPAASPGFTRLNVDGVGYTYPGSDRPALRDITMKIGCGEVVAVVGENGSGKTTLATLLAGLRVPTTGSISSDGVPIGEPDLAAVRRGTAAIFQDFARFQLTAAENIAIGRAGETPDSAAVRAAAVRAGADRFLAALPHGYDTMLSKAVPGGVDLSIGQWQRVALARAIHRDAGFVVLDEPTSALDPRAEHELFGRVRDMFAGKSVLLISHRFGSVRDADRIYVMADGEIIEHGDHASLMAQDGHYAELFNLQAQAYVDR
jgi:ATP-binding cassette subfamily B protein